MIYKVSTQLFGRFKSSLREMDKVLFINGACTNLNNVNVNSLARLMMQKLLFGRMKTLGEVFNNCYANMNGNCSVDEGPIRLQLESIPLIYQL